MKTVKPLVLILPLLAACTAAPPPVVEPPPPEPEPVEEYKNTLRWTTASEVDNFGFDIYRSTSEDGPFERLTEEPVAGSGTTDLPTEYAWADDSIDPHRTYYYYVESISMQGVREQFTPIIKAPPKIPDGGDAVPSDSEETAAEPEG